MLILLMKINISSLVLLIHKLIQETNRVYFRYFTLCGITTPLHCLVMFWEPFLTYYEGLENMLKSCEGLRVNIANAISIEPPDTGGHETYMQLAVDMDSIEERD